MTTTTIPAVRARGSVQGVHIQLGHLEEKDDGALGFTYDTQLLISRDEAVQLREDLTNAIAEHLNLKSHGG